MPKHKDNHIKKSYQEEDSPLLSKIPAEETDSSLPYYLNQLKNFNTLTEEEERELIAKIKMGDLEARKKFIESNLKLVLKVVLRYSGFGVNIMDLIQDGNIGLISSVDKFNPDLGFRFSTYAMWWIKQAIVNTILTKGNVVYRPFSAVRTMKKVLKVRSANKDASLEEISKKSGITIDRIREVELLLMAPISLETYKDQESKIPLSDIIKDVSQINPEEMFMKKYDQEIAKILSFLTPKEQEVIIMRFGLHGDRIYSLREISQKFGLTRERIRQIEKNAIKKLSEERYGELEDFI